MRRLRADILDAQVPVVAVTALAMQATARLQLAGFDGYVEKPISVPDSPARWRGFLRGEAVMDEP